MHIKRTDFSIRLNAGIREDISAVSVRSSLSKGSEYALNCDEVPVVVFRRDDSQDSVRVWVVRLRLVNETVL